MGSSTGCGEAEGSPSWSIGRCRIWRTPIRSAKAWWCGGASSNKRRLTPQVPSRGFSAWIDWCRTRAGWLGPPCLASATALIQVVYMGFPCSKVRKTTWPGSEPSLLQPEPSNPPWAGIPSLGNATGGLWSPSITSPAFTVRLDACLAKFNPQTWPQNGIRELAY